MINLYHNSKKIVFLQPNYKKQGLSKSIIGRIAGHVD